MKIIGHRGGLFYRPENTRAAFQHSVDTGVEWVECDVRLARDKLPVVSHDERVNLNSQAPRMLRDLSRRDLKLVDLGGGEPLLTLEELFREFGARLQFDLDIKEPDAIPGVIKLVRRMGLHDRAVISSFLPEALEIAAMEGPEIPRGLLLDRLTGVLVDVRSGINAARLLKCAWLLPQYRIVNREWVEAAHAEGMQVVTWTVNRPGHFRRMVKLGVDGVITDKPGEFD